MKLRKTGEEMQQRRMPVTQIFDYIKTQFTTLENSISPKHSTSIYAKVQAIRDKYAADKIAQQRRKEAEAQKKLDMDKELIRLKSEVQTQLSGFFLGFMNSRIGKLTMLFNSLTLTNWDEIATAIQKYSCEYPHEHFESFTPQVTRIYASEEQMQAIIIECTKGKFGQFSDEFRSKMISVHAEVLDRLSSRKTELQEIANADAARAAEMQAAADKRKADEAARMKKEEEERTAAAASKINTEAQASYTNSLFDAQQTIAAAPTASARESYEIEVLNPLGYSLIAAFYFEHEGKTETIAKLEKKTLGSMKKFCEAYAMKNDVKISSPFLKYNDKFKTIAKK